MIGPKKLSTIRQQIAKALGSPAQDPVERLERQIASAKRKGERTEIMEGLLRFLEAPREMETVQDPVRAKK